MFNRDVNIMVDYLCQGIPPIERWDDASGEKRPFNLVSVINAAWVTYLTRIDEFYGSSRIQVGPPAVRRWRKALSDTGFRESRPA